MAKQKAPDTLAGLQVNSRNAAPLYTQIYTSLRDRILQGKLPAGMRLPSARTLSQSLGVSRNTVTAAFLQLVSEGYCEQRRGNGAFVSSSLPEALLQPAVMKKTTVAAAERKAVTPAARNSSAIEISQRGRRYRATQDTPIETTSQGVFKTGTPALKLFPMDIWQKCLKAPLNSETLGYQDAAGYMPLRKAIAAYLGASRDVYCSPENIIIVNGAQQALHILSLLLMDEGTPVWMEEPGYQLAAQIFRANGARIIPTPVSQRGFEVETALQLDSSAKIAYVTPSHQYPTGAVMPIAQRMELLQWAQQTGGWILEDDYDSEFRYTGHPLPAMQGIDTDGRVIYIGTFSKSMFPSLRMGYIAAPPTLAPICADIKNLLDRSTAIGVQATLAKFINDGYFMQHIRRMRVIYAQRQAALKSALDTHLADLAQIRDVSPAGLHVTVELKNPAPQGYDTAISQKALSQGIIAPALSYYYSGAVKQQGFVLGFGNGTPQELENGVQILRKLLRA